MKILQVNKYNYIRGGSDSVYFNTTQLLQEEGHDVLHFAMEFPENVKDDQSFFFAKNNDFTQQNTFGKIKNMKSFFYNVDAKERLEKLIEIEKPDIAHFHIFYGSLTSSVLQVLKKHNIPIVVSIHDYKFICSAYLMLDNKNAICEKCKGKNHFHTIVNKCVKGSTVFSAVFAMESYFRDFFFPVQKMFDGVIFVSKFSQGKHLQFRPELKGIAKHLYNFDPAINSKIPNHNKGDYYLYAGRLSKEKGLLTLIRAFNLLPNLSLKIAGTGPEMKLLMEIANSNIQFLGFQKGEVLQDLIKGASFSIVPSEWYENNPMAIIESYSLGKPVIGAKIGGIPEIVIEEQTGFLFNPGDVNELVTVILKTEKFTNDNYLKLSQNSVRFANDHFHPEVHYASLMNIYQSVLHQSVNS
jgi:glycosyltransferase involved in cell wall biosynthesis